MKKETRGRKKKPKNKLVTAIMFYEPIEDIKAKGESDNINVAKANVRIKMKQKFREL